MKKLLAAFSIIFIFAVFAYADTDLEINLDAKAATINLPKIFRPSIDLSGRGFSRQNTRPQNLAADEALGAWQKDIGFNSLYRVQYNLWEIAQLAKDKEAQDKLLNNYEAVIKNISGADGIVVLNLFGTPAGLGRVLDKRSPPLDLKAFKALIKDIMRKFSCEKRYNIWYEVWNAPDLDDFFLGRRQEYLNMYRMVAESARELEAETKIHIPVGGPSVSWWFQNLDGNTIINPEKSLIYELIKYCYHYRLPLDFVSWHGYSSNPSAEKEVTIYKKKLAVSLIREWLSYFRFLKDTPLIVDEWNYDRDTNILAERQEKAYIAASFIPARLQDMYEAGINYQLYFSLEDFKGNKEGVRRNTGIFTFEETNEGYKGSPKVTYNVFKMLKKLGAYMFTPKLDDDFAGAIATKTEDGLAVLIYNYIDTNIVNNYLSQNIAGLNNAERKFLLSVVKSDKLGKIINRQMELKSLRVPKQVSLLLKRCQELNDRAVKFKDTPRNIKLTFSKLKGNYIYQKYTIDSSCSLDCEFKPAEEKEINILDTYQEQLAMKPYSVNLIILKEKAVSQDADKPTEPKKE